MLNEFKKAEKSVVIFRDPCFVKVKFLPGNATGTKFVYLVKIDVFVLVCPRDVSLSYEKFELRRKKNDFFTNEILYIL